MKSFELLYLIALMLSWLIGSLGNSFIDSHDFQHDNHTLQQGSNLLYFSLGSKEHNLEIAQHIISFYKLRQWGCYDVHQHTSISDYVHGASSSEEVKFVVVHGLECLSASERRSLDFAYRLTDSSIDVSHVVILFTLETTNIESSVATHAVDTTPAHHTKLQLAESLNEESAFFNGHAFTGRLARTFFESNMVSIDIPAPGCETTTANTQKDICTLLTSAAQAAQPNFYVALKPHHDYSSMSVALFVMIAMVGILVVVSMVRCFIRCNSNHEYEHFTPAQQPNSVSATVHGSSGMNYSTTNPYVPTPYDNPVDLYSEPFASRYATPEASPQSQRTEGVTRRSLTRSQAKQASHSNTSSPTNTDITATTTATTGATPVNNHKDRRSTGSTTVRRTIHKTTTSISTGPSGEESFLLAEQGSEEKDARAKKHARSARF